jgi:hypothetical protein
VDLTELARLPGAADQNFEVLTRAIVSRRYGRLGTLREGAISPASSSTCGSSTPVRSGSQAGSGGGRANGSSSARATNGLTDFVRVPDGGHDDGHPGVAGLDRERILRKPVLGGLINEYARAA